MKTPALSPGASVTPLLPEGDTFEFLRLIWSIDQALQNTSARMKRTLGVTGPQRFVIRLLGRFPGLTVTRLAELLRVHPSTVSGILKRLEARGLLERRTDTRDRRRAFLGLTTKGRGLDVEAGGTVETAVRDALGRLPKYKADHAREVLSVLAQCLADLDTRTPAAPRTRRSRPR
jgi:DNA-binding MarR family transcriptional regulator